MRVRGGMGCKREKERVIRDVGGDMGEWYQENQG